jgi:hypothetical protein
MTVAIRCSPSITESGARHGAAPRLAIRHRGNPPRQISMPCRAQVRHKTFLNRKAKNLPYY